MRHSAAHLLAAAVQRIWPDARFGVGPATETGFYYDIEVPDSIRLEDLSRIEEAMRALKDQDLPFVRREMPIAAAIDEMERRGQPFKVDLLQLLMAKGTTAVASETGDDALAEGVESVSFYQVGDFVDLCRGPHVASTREIGALKLVSVAGAYWRGDERNPQLQRIYGLAFETQAELERCLWEMEQARLRDHRKLGADLGIFTFSDHVGRGLPLWLPRGVAIRDELEALAREEERRAGYERVVTPHITKEGLYYRSGHLPYYKQDMYSPMDIDGELYYLRPMNCPHHHEVYLARPRSYRDLPVRLAEYGMVYRYENSGALSGLMRTRGFCQNDAHLYCRYDQTKDEFLRVMRMHARYYDLLGIQEYYMLLAKPDRSKLDKYVDDPAAWEAALDIILEVMRESGLPFREKEGEAAFYGPKVDFVIKSAIGTEYAISTNQLDFLATRRFGLTYKGEDQGDHPVYVIHRAPLGSHERFVAFLLEHFGGKFPVWLAPVQVRLIPIADRHAAFAEQVKARIEDSGIATGTGVPRVEVDAGGERMQKRIRTAQQEKIPYMLIVGDAEAASDTVSVRLRDGTDLGKLPVAEFIDRLRQEIAGRNLTAF